jgi:hypothetical protein
MKNAPKSGTLAMIQPAWHHLSGSNDHRAGELYQTSLMSALMAGIYEGDAAYGQIRKHGDFGVGLLMISMVKWSASTGRSINFDQTGPFVR